MSYSCGKSGRGVYQTIINQIPPHKLYAELFLGGGPVLLAKKPAACSFCSDIDPDVIRSFQNRIDSIDPKLPPYIYVLCANALEILSQAIELFSPWDFLNRSDAFLYLDPPYLLETDHDQDPLHNHEMSYQEHERLLTLILELDSKVAISGYWSELYAVLLKDWRSIHLTNHTRSGRQAVEYLWMNYPPPKRLHDYSYLGSNFRERERIKRKIKCWQNKLANMPDLERRALIAAFRDYLEDQTWKLDPIALLDELRTEVRRNNTETSRLESDE